jgi:hypothetical protein
VESQTDPEEVGPVSSTACLQEIQPITPRSGPQTRQAVRDSLPSPGKNLDPKIFSVKNHG